MLPRRDQRLCRSSTDIRIVVAKRLLGLIPPDFDGWESGKASEAHSRLAIDFKEWETDNPSMPRRFPLTALAELRNLLRLNEAGKKASFNQA